MSIPDEFELLSLFECEPTLLDRDVPFFYNKATYEFINSVNERFIVSICPSYSDIKIQVYSANNNELLSVFDFIKVDAIFIISDKREESKIEIRTEVGVVCINFKPRFKVYLSYANSELL